MTALSGSQIELGLSDNSGRSRIARLYGSFVDGINFHLGYGAELQTIKLARLMLVDKRINTADITRLWC